MLKISVTFLHFPAISWSVSDPKRQYVWHFCPQPRNITFLLRNIILKIFPNKILPNQLNRPCKFEQRKATQKLSTFVQIKLCRREKKIKYIHDTETNYSLKTVAYVKLNDKSVLLFQCLALGIGNAVAKVTIKIKSRHSHLRLLVTHHTIFKGLKRLQNNFPCQLWTLNFKATAIETVQKSHQLKHFFYDLASCCILVIRPCQDKNLFLPSKY